MIVEYHRPETLDLALELLQRPGVQTVPLGGGTVLNQPSNNPVAVVDLQNLGLTNLAQKGNNLEIGATVTLEQLLKFPELYPDLVKAIRHEATYNTRQMATVAGALVAADGRSPFGTALLALGAQLVLQPGDEKVNMGDVLPLREEKLAGRLITHILIPANLKLTYEYVARTPADLPIVCVAVTQWKSGRTRVALGGYGSAPMLAMDGPRSEGADIAARDAYHEAGDQWASAAYRSDVAGTLVHRCLERE
jgi:CO/xanthine dehydrogenase FAD-binding subunit